MNTRTARQLIYVVMTSLSCHVSKRRLLPAAAGSPLDGHRDVMQATDDHVMLGSADLVTMGNSWEHVRAIVESLEHLGALPPANTCYTLQHIERTGNVATRGGDITVSLTLRLSHSTPSRATSATPMSVSEDKAAIVACSRTLVGAGAGGDHVTDIMTSQAAAGKAFDNMQEQVQPLLSSRQVSPVTNVTSLGSNVQLQDYDTYYNDTLRGSVGSTQMAVMGVCSAVIGVFFIAIVTLRIRNYCRRVFYKPRDEGHCRRPQRKKSAKSSGRTGFTISSRHLAL